MTVGTTPMGVEYAALMSGHAFDRCKLNCTLKVQIGCRYAVPYAVLDVQQLCYLLGWRLEVICRLTFPRHKPRASSDVLDFMCAAFG